jgi:hypothetical protein
MAKTGRKPQTAGLRLVKDVHRTTRHGDAGQAEEHVAKSAATFGDLQRPPHLFGQGLQAWRRYIEPAWWLDASREVTAIAFCDLWHEYCSNRKGFAAAKHQQLRNYMQELGLTDERNRFGIGRDKTGDEFFDDLPAAAG